MQHGETIRKTAESDEVTALRRRVRELEHEVGELKAMVDQIDVGVFVMDDPGGKAVVRRANPALARILGYPSADAVVGHSGFEHYADPKERFETQTQFMADPAFRASGTLRLEAVRRRYDTHEPVPVLLRLKATFDSEGKLARFYGVMEDTRDRARADRAFQAAEARFVCIFEASPVGMALTEPSGVVVRTNRALQATLGRTDADLLGRRLDAFATVASGESLLDAATRASGPVEASFSREDGTVAWALVTATVLRDDAGNPTQRVVMVQDITRRKRMYEELLRAAKLDSLALLAGGIAHDFNNILTPILGSLSLALGEATGEARSALQHAEQSVFRARELTRQLMMFARGGVTVKEPGRIADVVEECMALCLRGTNIVGSIEADDSRCLSDFDPSQMAQVFSSLFINAVQAMPAGGRVACRVSDVVSEGGGAGGLAGARYVRVSVTDEGCGIPVENLGRVFDPFFSTKQQGRGLGLATAHAIVTTHGGRVEVRSEVGRGTTFDVFLPASERAEGEDEPPPPEPAEERGRARLLVMDDEPAVRRTLTAMLTSCGYEVDAVADGDAAIEAYGRAREDRRPYAAVILDLTVPGGRGGADTMQRLLEIDPRACGIVSSGYSVGSVVEEPRGSGFVGVVHKPYTLDELRTTLARAFEQRRHAERATH